MKLFLASENDAGQRLDKFLQKAVPLLPKNLMYKYIRLKRIKINGKRCDIATKICTGDQISMYIVDEFFESTAKTFFSAPSDIDIVFEDDNILLVNKPVDLCSQPDNNNMLDCLINRVLHYLYKSGAYSPSEELSFSPALCNRLDRNTQGIVIVAKNFHTLQLVNKKIAEGEIKKFYLCIVEGKLQKKSNLLTGYHVKNINTNKSQITQNSIAGSKLVQTKYTVLKQKEDKSLVQVELITGKSHQIRAHMSSIGHPLVGDVKYGGKSMGKDNFQSLCSYKVTFAFTTDAQHLSYLKDKSFEVQKIAFKDSF